MVAAYLKAFLKKMRMAFSFLEYLFFILAILTFLYYAGWVSDGIFRVCNLNDKILNKEYLWKYKGSVFEIK